MNRLEQMEIDLENAQKENEKLRRLALKDYVVTIPKPSGSGRTVDQLQEMALVMKALYDETQVLIKKSRDMIQDIIDDMEAADHQAVGK